jgi:hypothetical protein
MPQTLALAGTSERPDNVVPAHIFERRRRERERRRRVANTIFAQAIEREEATP